MDQLLTKSSPAWFSFQNSLFIPFFHRFPVLTQLYVSADPVEENGRCQLDSL